MRTTRPQDCAPLWRVEPADKPRDPLTLKNAKGERLELKFDKLATTGEVGATSEAELKALDDGEIYTRAKDGSWSRSTRARIAAGDATFFHYHAGALKKIKPAAAAQAPPARRGAAIGVIDDDDAALAECEAHPLWLESRALCLRVDDNLQIHLVHIPGRYRERIVPRPAPPRGRPGAAADDRHHPVVHDGHHRPLPFAGPRREAHRGHDRQPGRVAGGPRRRRLVNASPLPLSWARTSTSPVPASQVWTSSFGRRGSATCPESSASGPCGLFTSRAAAARVWVDAKVSWWSSRQARISPIGRTSVR